MPKKMPQIRFDSIAHESRPTAHQRGYDRNHTAMRNRLLRERPFCDCFGLPGHELCEGWSVEAHHKVYKQNMQLTDYAALCVYCHHKIEREK